MTVWGHIFELLKTTYHLLPENFQRKRSTIFGSAWFAIVTIHPPSKSYATRVFEFTSSLEAMVRNVGTMKAQGGGDTPESVACGLHAALKLPWRPNSVKVSSFNPDTVMLPPSNACWQLVVCISDAPPVRFLKSCTS